MSAPAIELRELRVTYPGPPPVRAVDDVSLAVAPGECLGILGESGSGKSTLARALLGLLPEAAVEGELRLGEVELGTLDEAGWQDVRWRRIALSFQSAASLNPVLRVGEQVAEPLHLHLGMDARAARERAGELLQEVGLGAWAAPRYPNELSGGQRRLALLAMALSCDPEVVVLDEPTAGLDPLTRERVLAVLHRLRRAQTTLLMLSHDADAVEMVADRAVVLYRGWLAEVGPATAVLGDPRNPYSWGLLNARPTLASVKDLRGIRGDAPDPAEVAAGCPFFGRCTQGLDDICTPARPPLIPPHGEDGKRLVACVRGGVVPVLSARGLRKSYRVPGGGLRRSTVPAVDGVNVEVREAEVVGLVGATGAGKSTLGMLLLRLLEPDGGSISFEGRDLLAARGAELKAARRRVQMLFQDPFEALSARFTVANAVREPLDTQGIGDPDERDEVVRAMVATCRLPSDDAFLRRYTHELSGGQLQRVALARALVLEPKLLIADEAVAMLDPSEQAKMIQLLKHLQVERGMSMVFISHDLAVVLRVADRVLVLENGRLVEEGPGTRLLTAPKHPATRALLAAAGRDLLFPVDEDSSGNGHRRHQTPTPTPTDYQRKDPGLNIEQDTLDRIVDFHGHLCPGLAMGVQAAQLALREIGPHSKDEEVVAVTETDMCGVDAIQFLTGCTFGKGNLVHRDWGKNAYTFFRRSDGKAVRVVGRPDAWQRDPEHQALFAKVRSGEASDEERDRFGELHEAQSRRVLELSPDDLFSIEEVQGPPPAKARIHTTVVCEQCGEGVMETRVSLLGGRQLCPPCFEAAATR